MRIPSEDKYLNDAQFRMMVDQMLNLITQLKTSFSEIREAALFAQLKYEMSNPRPVSFSPELLREIEFRSGIDKAKTPAWRKNEHE